MLLLKLVTLGDRKKVANLSNITMEKNIKNITLIASLVTAIGVIATFFSPITKVLFGLDKVESHLITKIKELEDKIITVEKNKNYETCQISYLNYKLIEKMNDDSREQSRILKELKVDDYYIADLQARDSIFINKINELNKKISNKLECDFS